MAGADPSMNVEDGDPAAIQMLEYEFAEQVAVWHGFADPDVFGKILFDLGMFYNTAFLTVEENPGGGGSHALEVLTKRLYYPRLYYRQKLDTESRRVNFDKPGWRTDARTKTPMMSRLRSAVKNKEIILHDRATVLEMTRVVFDPKKKGSVDQIAAIPPDHDDLTVALGLAWAGREQFFPDVEDKRVGMEGAEMLRLTGNQVYPVEDPWADEDEEDGVNWGTRYE